MDWVFIIVAAGTVIIGGTWLYLYQRKYEKHVNQALEKGNTKKMKSTITMLLIVLASFTFLVILFNFLPVLKEPDIDLEGRIQSGLLTETEEEYNGVEFTIYDMKFVDGGYVISYSNDIMNCGYGTCSPDLYTYGISQISFYDESGTKIWQLGGHLNGDIAYENYQLDARAVDRLQDGTFVAIAKYVDLDTTISGLLLMMIDESGTITDLKILDSEEYDIPLFSGFQYYELSADDNGYVIRITDSYYGSLVMKFNEEHDFVWSYIPDSAPYYEGTYVQSLAYENGLYYILQRNSAVALDNFGEEVWNYSVSDYSVSTMQYYDGQLYLLGSTNAEFQGMENLLNLSEYINRYSIVFVESIDASTGSSIEKYTFSYDDIIYSQTLFNITPRFIFKDEEGNLYILSGDRRFSATFYDDDVYIMYILKYDSKGQFQGMSIFEGNYGFFNDNLYNTIHGQYKVTVEVVDDSLEWYSPTLSIHRTIDLSTMIFHNDINNEFNPQLFSSISYLRVLFNKLTITIYAVLALAFIIMRLRQENRRVTDRYEEFNERHFWD